MQLQFIQKFFTGKPFEYGISFILSLFDLILVFTFFNQQTYISKTRFLILLICFLVFFLLNVLFYFVLVKPTLKGVSAWQLLLTSIFCLVCAAYLLTYSPKNILQLHVFPENLSIELSEIQNLPSNDQQLTLTGFSTNQQDISFDILTNASWKRTGNELHADLKNFSPVNWKGFASESILTFKTGPSGPQISIRWNGEETIVDTFSEKPGFIEIKQEHIPFLIEKILIVVSYILSIAWMILLFYSLNKLVWEKTSPSKEKSHKTTQLPEGFLLSLILALFCFVLMLILSSSFGVLLATDSSSYLNCGRQLADGNGYISGDGDAYVWWGPLYPGIIALLNFLPPIDIFFKIQIFNALLYAATIFLSALIYHELLNPKTLLQKSGLLLFPAAGWFMVRFNYLLSEAVYIFLLVLFFYAFNKYLDTKKRRWVFVFTLAACGHILTRYNGVTLAISACLVILIFFKESLKNRLLKAFSFGISSTAPLVLWLAHNFYLKHMLTGKRPKASLSLLDNVKLASNVISRWFLPFKWEFMTLLILTIFCVILLLLFIKKKSEQKFDPQIKVSLLLVFSVSFLSQMIISLSIIENTPLNNRLLSAVYIPITLGFCWIFQKLFFYIKKKFPGLPYRAAAVILLCSLFFQPLISYKEFNEIKTQPVSNSFFYSKFFEQSQITEYLKQIKIEPDQLWYSNCARCTLVFSEKLTLIFEPYSSNKKGYLPDGNKAFFLVWFTDFYAEGINQKLEPITEIKNLTDSPLQIKELHEFNDGNIYFVLPIKED